MVPMLVLALLALLVLVLMLVRDRALAMWRAAAQCETQHRVGGGASGVPTIARGTKLLLSSGLPRRLFQTSFQPL